MAVVTQHSPETPSPIPGGETVVPLRIRGLGKTLQLRVHGERDRVVSQRIRETGLWEPFETELLQALLSPGDVFVDAGANIGYFSVLAAALVGAEGAVFAFEPDPDNCRLLRDNLRRNACEAIVHLVEAGLAEQAGDAALFLSADNLGDHQLFPAAGERRQQRAIRLLRGSDYLAPRLQRLDLLKIDTQGAEQSVLSGLMPLLRALPGPLRIMVELTPFSLRQAGSSGRALIETLATLDQPLWIIDHVEHRLAATTAAELATWCDNIDAWPEDRGFMNILLGPPPSSPPGRS